MKIEPFATEQFFADYEFQASYPLALSDCETMSVGELLALADVPQSQLNEVTLGYTHPQGHRKLRSLVASLHQTVQDDDVVVLTSPVEGIFLAMQTLLEKGDEVVSLVPAYDALNNVARRICGNLKLWELEPADQHWELNFDRLTEMVSPRTKLIIVNFPQNPTGFLPSTRQMEQLIEIARDNDAWIFCDEMYRGLEFGHTIASAIDVYDKSIVLGGLSKTYGLAGLRAGWLMVKDRNLRAELINWKYYTTICPSATTEFLAMVALMVAAEIREFNKKIVLDNLALATDFFDRWSMYFTWRPPQAGSVALVQLDLEQLKSRSATEYCHALAREQGILLLPGKCLGYTDDFVRFGFGRISFAKSLSQYDQFLQRMAR